MHRIFLLSPASCRGRRAELLFRDGADFQVARGVRAPGGIPIGEVFTFLSGLYFRGKLRYAREFGRAPDGTDPVQVITSTRGLVSAETPVTLADLREFAEGDIGAEDVGFTAPLERTARELGDELPEDAPVVLLGSIATDKYLRTLLDVFGSRLGFPETFIGRGDMSRGGLLLRAADDGAELEYVVARDAPRRGRRPARLTPRRQGLVRGPGKEGRG